MKEYHILNGDCLAEQLGNMNGNKIVLRECLVEGDVKGDSLEQVLTGRYEFFKNEFGVSKEEYEVKSIKEISQIQEFEHHSVVNLWFENDLFCQVNFWFAVSHLKSRDGSLYLVSPQVNDWSGFGKMSFDTLQQSYESRKSISKEDQSHISDLWKAYQQSDWQSMRHSGAKLSKLIDNIEDVVEAHIDRFPMGEKCSRPEKSLVEILARTEKSDFKTIFEEFSRVEGIYGFGDVQVKRLLNGIELL